MIPFITCEVSLCQYVCELVLGASVIDLDLGVQIDSVRQPIKSNSVGSGNMSHCWASSLVNHLDDCFVVFKDAQQSLLMRRRLMEHNQCYSTRWSSLEIFDFFQYQEVAPFSHESESCFRFYWNVLQEHRRRRYGIEIQIPSTTRPDQNSWVVICRGRNRFVDELHLREIRDTVPRIMNYFWKDLLQKKVNFVLQSWSNPASRNSHARRSLKF